MPGLSTRADQRIEATAVLTFSLFWACDSPKSPGARSEIRRQWSPCASPAARQRTLADRSKSRASHPRLFAASDPGKSPDDLLGPGKPLHMTSRRTAYSDTGPSPECRKVCPTASAAYTPQSPWSAGATLSRRRRTRSRELCHHRPPLRQPADLKGTPQDAQGCRPQPGPRPIPRSPTFWLVRCASPPCLPKNWRPCSARRKARLSPRIHFVPSLFRTRIKTHFDGDY